MSENGIMLKLIYFCWKHPKKIKKFIIFFEKNKMFVKNTYFRPEILISKHILLLLMLKKHFCFLFCKKKYRMSQKTGAKFKF